MNAERKQTVARATEDLLLAIRELARAEADKNFNRTSAKRSAPQRKRFLLAIDAFAEAIGR
jgi:hypothetical protein